MKTEITDREKAEAIKEIMETNLKIKPLGFYVLIEMEEFKTGSVIVRTQEYLDKEQDATSVGYVRAIGPTAYVGYPGCDLNTPDGPLTAEEQLSGMSSATPHGCWGLEIGQKIEYRKFEGKKSTVKGYENYRYIPDSHIIGGIEDE